MMSLIENTPEALKWLIEGKIRCAKNPAFSTLHDAVLWTDEVCADGTIIGGAEPSEWITNINRKGWPLYKGHDPGFPAGRVIAAGLFSNPNGVRFVAGILGFYGDSVRTSFQELGIDPTPVSPSPSSMNIPTRQLLDKHWISVGTDPREVESSWVSDLLKKSPLPTKTDTLSHNSGEISKELVQIGIPFALILWNPLVSSVSKEAGKDIYIGTRRWLKRLWKKLLELKDPVTLVGTNVGGCQILFRVRGNNIEQNYKAQEALPIAAAQAENLVSRMKRNDKEISDLLYEFDKESSRWFPSYAILQNGKLISDNSLLIALENLPTGLSLGIQIDENSGKYKFNQMLDG